MSSSRPISPAGSSSPACLTALPNEVLEHVFTLLAIPDRLRVNRVSRVHLTDRLTLIAPLGMQAFTRSIHGLCSVAIRLSPGHFWQSRRALLSSSHRPIEKRTLTRTLTLTLALALAIPHFSLSCALSPPELSGSTTCPGPRRLSFRVPLGTSCSEEWPAPSTGEGEVTSRARATVGDHGFCRDEKVHYQRTGGGVRASRRDVSHL
jgi:hypothetical protein